MGYETSFLNCFHLSKKYSIDRHLCYCYEEPDEKRKEKADLRLIL